MKTLSQRGPVFERRPAPLPNLLSFRVHNSQIQSKPIIINKQNDSQDEKLVVAKIMSDVVVNKFNTYILKSNEKI